MRNRSFPVCTDSSVTSTELISVLWGAAPAEISQTCGVDLNTVDLWRTGAQPVPYPVFQLLRFLVLGIVPAGFGAFSGWQFKDGRFGPPTEKNNARWEEILHIDHYRLDRDLCIKQADLIEGLTRQRDFYKRQCGLEARAGLMLNQLYSSDSIPPRS
jgi:hypothetical protein